jgi:hypothetical protein
LQFCTWSHLRGGGFSGSDGQSESNNNQFLVSRQKGRGINETNSVAGAIISTDLGKVHLDDGLGVCFLGK